MKLAPKSLEENEDLFITLALANPHNQTLLERLRDLDLPDCWLVSGCLVHSVWNRLSNNPPGYGINDYDVFYFEDVDLSWEAEDKVIRKCAAHFADLNIRVEVRNQARVHLWYEQKFGQAYSPLQSSCESIDRFLTTTTAIGLRLDQNGSIEIYSLAGVEDALNKIVRPNKWAARLPDRYLHKAARWKKIWPEIEILPWAE